VLPRLIPVLFPLAGAALSSLCSPAPARLLPAHVLDSEGGDVREQDGKSDGSGMIPIFEIFSGTQPITEIVIEFF
jgi:hypothetical protein